MSTLPYPHLEGLSKVWLKAKQMAAYTVRTAQGRICPMPDPFKHALLRRYLKRFGLRTFVETGTYMGDTVNSVRHLCDQAYSVEVDERLYLRAKQRFQDHRNIHILKGNSAEVLPSVLPFLAKPALFWLDAHFPTWTAGHKELLCPTPDEVRMVLAHRPDHVVLIDDAREFRGRDGYPTIEEMRALAPGYHFEVKDDIMRIHQ